MRWFEQHRQEWIAETLRVFGFINRIHLERKFGVSTPQASHDLHVFQREHPDVIWYDKTAKCYVRRTPEMQTEATPELRRVYQAFLDNEQRRKALSHDLKSGDDT